MYPYFPLRLLCQVLSEISEIACPAPNLVYLQECLLIKIISLTQGRMRPRVRTSWTSRLTQGGTSWRFLRAPSPKIGCEEADHFEDDCIMDSQLLRYSKAPTKEEKPEGPDQSPEVEEIPLLSLWMG